MAYTLPQFNVDVRVWLYPNEPLIDPPDFPNIPCQLYRASLVTASLPLAQIRVDPATNLGTAPITPGALGNPICECPIGSGDYFKIDGITWIHRGFPNEYIIWRVSPNQPVVGTGGSISSDTGFQ